MFNGYFQQNDSMVPHCFTMLPKTGGSSKPSSWRPIPVLKISYIFCWVVVESSGAFLGERATCRPVWLSTRSWHWWCDGDFGKCLWQMFGLGIWNVVCQPWSRESFRTYKTSFIKHCEHKEFQTRTCTCYAGYTRINLEMLAAAFWFQHHTWGGKGMFQALFIFMFFSQAQCHSETLRATWQQQKTHSDRLEQSSSAKFFSIIHDPVLPGVFYECGGVVLYHRGMCDETKFLSSWIVKSW